MKNQNMIKRMILFASLVLCVSVGFAKNIDPYEDGSQYAYGENVGWLNFEPGEGPGVTVSDSNLVGYVWAENIGWINLWPDEYGGVFNDGNGLLSGYAWSENIGWINFDPTVPGDSNDYGVSIDDDGIFNGWAWGENIGWIHLRSETPIVYKVQTAWFIPNKPPVVTCQDVTVSAGPDCTADASIDNGSYDPDGDPITISQDPPGPYGLGYTDVTLTVTDDKSESDTCSATVTVLDTTPPVITCPGDLTLECDGSGNTDQVNSWLDSAAASDTCGGTTITNDFSGLSDGCGATGTATVTWTAVDDYGNSASCSATVRVIDTTPPDITCPADVTLECPADTSIAATGSATGSDTCGDVTITHSDSSVPGCGNTEVIARTWTAIDECGNSSSCVQMIMVEDTTPPVITCPSDLTLECDGSGNTAQISSWLASATASDTCSSTAITNDFSGLSDDCGATGTATVTWTAVDDCGNLASCSATVTVIDTTPPDITCPADVILECPADTAPSMTGEATATDTCGDVTITYSDVSVPGPGNTETITRTWTATDECGNSSSCVQTIAVVDTTPPEISLSVDPNVLWPPNHKMVLITPSWTVSDICDESPDVSLISIVMNEGDETNAYDPTYDDTLGDGHTMDDIQVDTDGSIYLRAERSGKGDGRIYTITYQAVDDSGNVVVQSATVTVPHNQP